jgi:hypothetical protein
MSSVSVVAIFKSSEPYTLPNVTQHWWRSPKLARVFAVRCRVVASGQNVNNPSVYIEAEPMSNLNKRR